MPNLDIKTVSGFGDEWVRMDQSSLSPAEHEALFQAYFHIFPWKRLSPDSTGFDLGCGSGRWAKKIAPRVGRLHLIDASEQALAVAKRNLKEEKNCEFHCASVDSLPLKNNSMDFGYSLGVLHHVPNTQEGLISCVEKLKPGAPFLLYLYYALDNRPYWYQKIWRSSDLLRRVVSVMPYKMRFFISQVLAATLYWPLARMAFVLEKLHLPISFMPLSYYRDKSFYTMRTDSLDRFGTRLEQRYTRQQIADMMHAAGLINILFSDKAPFWVALGFKKNNSDAHSIN